MRAMKSPQRPKSPNKTQAGQEQYRRSTLKNSMDQNSHLYPQVEDLDTELVSQITSRQPQTLNSTRAQVPEHRPFERTQVNPTDGALSQRNSLISSHHPAMSTHTLAYTTTKPVSRLSMTSASKSQSGLKRPTAFTGQSLINKNAQKIKALKNKYSPTSAQARPITPSKVNITFGVKKGSTSSILAGAKQIKNLNVSQYKQNRNAQTTSKPQPLLQHSNTKRIRLDLKDLSSSSGSCKGGSKGSSIQDVKEMVWQIKHKKDECSILMESLPNKSQNVMSARKSIGPSLNAIHMNQNFKTQIDYNDTLELDFSQYNNNNERHFKERNSEALQNKFDLSSFNVTRNNETNIKTHIQLYEPNISEMNRFNHTQTSAMNGGVSQRQQFDRNRSKIGKGSRHVSLQKTNELVFPIRESIQNNLNSSRPSIQLTQYKNHQESSELFKTPSKLKLHDSKKAGIQTISSNLSTSKINSTYVKNGQNELKESGIKSEKQIKYRDIDRGPIPRDQSPRPVAASPRFDKFMFQGQQNKQNTSTNIMSHSKNITDKRKRSSLSTIQMNINTIQNIKSDLKLQRRSTIKRAVVELDDGLQKDLIYHNFDTNSLVQQQLPLDPDYFDETLPKYQKSDQSINPEFSNRWQEIQQLLNQQDQEGAWDKLLELNVWLLHENDESGQVMLSSLLKQLWLSSQKPQSLVQNSLNSLLQQYLDGVLTREQVVGVMMSIQCSLELEPNLFLQSLFHSQCQVCTFDSDAERVSISKVEQVSKVSSNIYIQMIEQGEDGVEEEVIRGVIDSLLKLNGSKKEDQHGQFRVKALLVSQVKQHLIGLRRSDGQMEYEQGSTQILLEILDRISVEQVFLWINKQQEETIRTVYDVVTTDGSPHLKKLFESMVQVLSPREADEEKLEKQTSQNFDRLFGNRSKYVRSSQKLRKKEGHLPASIAYQQQRVSLKQDQNNRNITQILNKNTLVKDSSLVQLEGQLEEGIQKAEMIRSMTNAKISRSNVKGQKIEKVDSNLRSSNQRATGGKTPLHEKSRVSLASRGSPIHLQIQQQSDKKTTGIVPFQRTKNVSPSKSHIGVKISGDTPSPYNITASRKTANVNRRPQSQMKNDNVNTASGHVFLPINGDQDTSENLSGNLSGINGEILQQAQPATSIINFEMNDSRLDMSNNVLDEKSSSRYEVPKKVSKCLLENTITALAPHNIICEEFVDHKEEDQGYKVFNDVNLEDEDIILRSEKVFKDSQVNKSNSTQISEIQKNGHVLDRVKVSLDTLHDHQQRQVQQLKQNWLDYLGLNQITYQSGVKFVENNYNQIMEAIQKKMDPINTIVEMTPRPTDSVDYNEFVQNSAQMFNNFILIYLQIVRNDYNTDNIDYVRLLNFLLRFLELSRQQKQIQFAVRVQGKWKEIIEVAIQSWIQQASYDYVEEATHYLQIHYRVTSTQIQQYLQSQINHMSQ